MVDPRQLRKSVVVLLIVIMLLIPGLVTGQDEGEGDQVPVVNVEIDSGESSEGVFNTSSPYFWILAASVLVIVLLLVFLIGRSGNSSGSR